MYFYIHVHLDKAQIATLARLKASSDVIKRDRIRCLNVESNTIYYHAEKKQDLGHVLGNQNRSHTSTFIHQQHDARKKIRRFLEEKLDTFFPLTTTQDHQKNAHVHLCVASRIGRNQSACVI